MNNKFVVSILILVIVTAGIYFILNNRLATPTPTPLVEEKTISILPSTPPQTPSINLLKACPEEWYENRMPSVGSSTTPREYFIYKGARRELSEFDVNWVKSNCSIKPQVVE